MSRKYDVVVTNPPYMGSSGMSSKLTQFVKDYYFDSKSDLFAAFIEHGNKMTKVNGFNCMVTMHVWMFLSSFETMRRKTISANDIVTLMHMENMVMGIAFGTAVTVFRNSRIHAFKGTYNHIKQRDIKNKSKFDLLLRENHQNPVCSFDINIRDLISGHIDAGLQRSPVCLCVDMVFLQEHEMNPGIEEFLILPEALCSISGHSGNGIKDHGITRL